MSAGTRISVCALCYGDYPQLAERCLSSIRDWFSDRSVDVELRVGLNACSARSLAVIDTLLSDIASHGVPVRTYTPSADGGNVCKYPLMRRMFRDVNNPLRAWTMWFDDDSYLEFKPGWDRQLLNRAQDADLVGQKWWMPVNGQRLRWMQEQPWFDPAIDVPPVLERIGRRAVEFIQGAWWLARTAVLAELDWPFVELNHNGGDSLLGEVLRHKGRRIKHFDEGVRINADETGKHSGAERRGYREPNLGDTYAGTALPSAEHAFDTTVTVFGFPKTTYSCKDSQRAICYSGR